ncbi:MAG: hypothetical protein GF329_10525 [Candidatus Lokiarchaeota archaeon]|nr:hypothetical protein [Candidatus Lokiarchaeota archaeon]
MIKKWKVIMNGTKKKDEYWDLKFLGANNSIANLIIPKSYFLKLYNCIDNYPNYHFQSCIKKIITSNGEDYSKKAMGVILAKPKYYDHKIGILYGELNSGEFKIFALWEEMLGKYSFEKRRFNKIITRLIETPSYFKDVSLILKCDS